MYVVESEGVICVFFLGIGNDVSYVFIEGIVQVGNGFLQLVVDDESMNSKVIRMFKVLLMFYVKDYILEIKYGKEDELGFMIEVDDDFEFVERV